MSICSKFCTQCLLTYLLSIHFFYFFISVFIVANKFYVYMLQCLEFKHRFVYINEKGRN